MIAAAGLALFAMGLLVIWGAVTNRSPIGLIRAGFTGGDFTDADPIK